MTVVSPALPRRDAGAEIALLDRLPGTVTEAVLMREHGIRRIYTRDADRACRLEPNSREPLGRDRGPESKQKTAPKKIPFDLPLG